MSCSNQEKPVFVHNQNAPAGHAPYHIRHHRLHDREGPISFSPSPNQSDGLKPEGIVLHDTAGRLDKGNSVRWLQNSQAKASAHLVIERDGTPVQLVPFNKKAWHAGKSSYQGRANVNDFTLGVEIVNPGRCSKRPDGAFKPWFSGNFAGNDPTLEFAYAQTPFHGKGWWLHYSEAQIQTITAICSSLIQAYDLQFLTTHYEISPGRKQDPNPLFPLEAVRAAVFATKKQSSGHAEKNLNKAWIPEEGAMRKWPSFHDNIMLTLPQGAVFEIKRQGYFDNGQGEELWYLGHYASQEGWVRAKNAKRLEEHADR